MTKAGLTHNASFTCITLRARFKVTVIVFGGAVPLKLTGEAASSSFRFISVVTAAAASAMPSLFSSSSISFSLSSLLSITFVVVGLFAELFAFYNFCKLV